MALFEYFTADSLLPKPDSPLLLIVPQLALNNNILHIYFIKKKVTGYATYCNSGFPISNW